MKEHKCPYCDEYVVESAEYCPFCYMVLHWGYCEVCGEWFPESEMHGSREHLICQDCFDKAVTVENVVKFSADSMNDELPDDLQDVFLINHFQYWHLKDYIGRLLNIAFFGDVNQGRVTKEELEDYIFGNENEFAEFIAEQSKKKKSQPRN